MKERVNELKQRFTNPFQQTIIDVVSQKLESGKMTKEDAEGVFWLIEKGLIYGAEGFCYGDEITLTFVEGFTI